MMQTIIKTDKKHLITTDFFENVDRLILDAARNAGNNNQEIIQYHLQTGGSRTRAQIAFKVGVALGLSTEQALLCAACVESLHNASLVHDDLQDKDESRRNYPAIWSKYDKNTAISIGDLMISSSYYLASKLDTPHLNLILKKIHQSLSITVLGQSDDLKVISRNTNIDEYLKIAENKSAPLFALASEICFLHNNLTCEAEVAYKVGVYFAIAYQLFDDYCDREADAICGEKNAYSILELSTDDPKKNLLSYITNYLESARECTKNLPLPTRGVLLDYIEQLHNQTQRVFHGVSK